MFKVKLRARMPEEHPRRRSFRARDAILSAAGEVAGDAGYQGAAIEEIARRAGTGKQTIYRWWASKPYLYLDVYEKLVPEPGLMPSGGGAVAELEDVFVKLFGFYASTPASGILAGLIAEAQADRAFAEALRLRLVFGRRHIVSAPLFAAREQGLMDPETDVELLTDLLFAAVWYALLIGGQTPGPDLARRIVRAVVSPHLSQKGPHDH